MWTDQLTAKEAFKHWNRGRRVGVSGRYRNVSDYWRKAWTPARGTEAWYQTARGFEGQPW